MHRTPSGGRRALSAAAAGALAAAALAGCSSSSDSDRQPPANDIATAARSSVRNGGTLHWAIDDVPQTLNVYHDGADAETGRIADATLPTLFTVDGHGRPQRDGDYLTSAEQVSSSPQTIVYHLNPQAVWNNGRPVTAADFVAQWKALNGQNTDFYAAHNAGYDRISSVRRGGDDREVKVVFAKPTAAWQSLFTPLYPKETTSSPVTFNESSHDMLPVGAGPFTVRDVDAEGGTITLVRNHRWWGDRAKLRRLVLTAVPRDRRAQALADGSVDVASVDTAELAAIGRIKDVAVHRAAGAAYTQLTLNGGGTGPLSDERVRKAIARAIDRQAIADSVLRPAGLPARTLGNHLVMDTQFGYQDNSSALGRTDPKLAATLLGESGWQVVRSGGASPTAAKAAAPQPTGASASASARASVAARASATASPSRSAAAAEAAATTSAGPSAAASAGTEKQTVVVPAAVRTDRTGNALTLRFMLPAGSPELVAVGNRIAHMLAAIGVRTEMDQVGDESFFRDHVATGDFDLALYTWPGSAFPADDARPIYLKPMPETDGSLDVRQNYARIGTDQIDQLLNRATTELDTGKARDLAQRADARLWAEAGSVPLYQPPQLVAMRTDVVNAGAFGFQTPRYQDVGFRV